MGPPGAGDFTHAVTLGPPADIDDAIILALPIASVVEPELQLKVMPALRGLNVPTALESGVESRDPGPVRKVTRMGQMVCPESRAVTSTGSAPCCTTC
jgi:hypothetical protein